TWDHSSYIKWQMGITTSISFRSDACCTNILFNLSIYSRNGTYLVFSSLAAASDYTCLWRTCMWNGNSSVRTYPPHIPPDGNRLLVRCPLLCYFAHHLAKETEQFYFMEDVQTVFR